MGVHPIHAALTTKCISNYIARKARQLLRRPEFHGVEIEEIEQDLALRVAQQAHLYDPNRSHDIGFIMVVVETGAAIMCRGRGRLKQGAELDILSLEGSRVESDEEEVSLLDRLVEEDRHRRHGGRGGSDPRQEDARIDFADALQQLSPCHRQVAKLLMNGGYEASIARDLGISRRQAGKAIEEIREHLRQLDLTEI
jgi:DNA-directed RNA polymerase specialized sigma24 family protein